MMKRMWLQAVRCATRGWRRQRRYSRRRPRRRRSRRSARRDHQQAIGFTLGGFFVKGEDSRVDRRRARSRDLGRRWSFDINDFNGVIVGGEWLFGLGDFLEAGVGVGLLPADACRASTATSTNDERLRDRAGSEAAHRADDGDRALPAARPRQRRAVRRRRHRRLQLALQRDAASSSTSRRLDLPRHASSRRARPSVRSSSAAFACPSPTLWTSAAKCGGRRPRATPKRDEPGCSATRSISAAGHAA